MRLLFLFPAILAASLAFLLPTASSQDAPATIVDIPLFQALAGKRTESGVLIPHASGQTLQGTAVSVGQPILGGLWFQIEGVANYDPVKWGYRWMFRAQQNGPKTSVYGIYMDTTGQKADYEGFYDPEEKRVQLIAKLRDGTGRFQMTLQDGGNVRIESVNSNVNDAPVVTYSAQNTKAE